MASIHSRAKLSLMVPLFQRYRDRKFIFNLWTRDIFRVITDLSIKQEIIRTELIWEPMSMSTMIIGIAHCGMCMDPVRTGIGGLKLGWISFGIRSCRRSRGC